MHAEENLEIKWLYDFIALNEQKNFSVAALSRHVSQPAFSRRIRALETWLGVPLFDRASYPIELTECGEKFIPYVAQLLKNVRLTKADFSAFVPHDSNVVRIDCLHSFAISLLPRLFSQSLEQFGDLNFSINPSVSGLDHQFESLLENTCDLLFSYDTPKIFPERLLENKLESICISRETVLPVIAPNLLESLGDSCTLPFLAFSEQTFLYTLVYPLIQACPLSLEPVFSATLSESLVRMAILGRGLAWVPWHAVEDAVHAGTLVHAFSQNETLTATLDVVCFRAKNNDNSAVLKCWQALQRDNFTVK